MSPAPSPTRPAVDEVTRLRLAVMRLARRLRQQGSEGITPSGLSVMGLLERHGPLGLGDLAAREAVKPPSITRQVNVLEEAGLVERETTAEDRRTVQVRLTPLGRRRLDAIRHQRNAWLSERLADLDAAGLDDLRRGVGAIERLLEQGP
ncbi:MAG TPA: MarR family transcriptional regulator [Candidatus Dormibacteraeota bacterium]|jgi:DNA-binding MarR family transcriptional regulator|nr:MarR family transcriptional regulator [Candidatus Dormibacteraeota bacterium]